jgi:leucyl aminopeptidase
MTRILRFTIPLLCFLSSTLFSQTGPNPQSPGANTDPIADIIATVSDSAIAADVGGLEAFGTRYALYANRHAVAEWIKQRFLDAGVADVRIDSFQESSYGTWQKNVIATIHGTSTGGEQLLIGAHYDSQSSFVQIAPGADDNASGTAGIIEMARVLRKSNYTPRATIIFVAFAAEEIGLLGSYDYADKAMVAGDNILLMQNYDMIAYRNPAQPDRHVAINVYSMAREEAVLDSTLMRTYTTLTPHLTTVNITRSDSWPFALRFFKPIFIIEDENDFNPRYHSPRDSSVYLDFSYAAEIIQSGIALTLTIDGTITKTEEVLDVPAIWGLEQNYPNPFNPTTEIRYSLQKEGRVRLRIHSVLGEVVAELVDRYVSAGMHTVSWSPNTASGVYYYTIEVTPSSPGGRVYRETKKMLFVQ